MATLDLSSHEGLRIILVSLEVLLDVGVRNVGILVEVFEGQFTIKGGFTFTVRAFKVEFTKEVGVPAA